MTNPELNEFLPFLLEPPPLRVDEGNVVRIGNSRIPIDLVVEQYENGATPEDMVRAYDALDLADVHAVIAFYLRHRMEMKKYLARREKEAKELQSQAEAICPNLHRSELLKRRTVREEDHAPTGK